MDWIIRECITARLSAATETDWINSILTFVSLVVLCSPFVIPSPRLDGYQFFSDRIDRINRIFSNIFKTVLLFVLSCPSRRSFSGGGLILKIKACPAPSGIDPACHAVALAKAGQKNRYRSNDFNA
jgi:hypothetical protein